MAVEANKPDTTRSADRSVGELVAEQSEQLTRLVRAELRLALTELRRKGKRAALGAGMFGMAGALALIGGGTLAACAVLALAQVWPAWLAALVVGGAILLLAGMIALTGRFEFRRATPPKPEWALTSVQEDLETIRKGIQ